MDEKRNPEIPTLARRFVVGLIAAGAGAALLAAGPVAAQPSDHVVSPSAVAPGGMPGGGANHSNVPPGSALWPGNMNPEADSGSARDAGPNSAAPIDPGDHPRDAPGADSPRS
ncbi:Uncharacterised protein (plasmid) [Tsukamurella tyrosinosolvens]|uniref:Uncharacterized protein n=1 Tax=Tsukamurella tyrosinosolvens TaxID=57704 RepID=A0A1H4NYP6_TSUTY|nr:hypothetical protein [Tsukamurella tyrosinosolvens]KXO97240.1 hypothetical protein AXK58_08380 [Tsukamurella tyrosinosolvens]SEB99968.1 hypothetical protein SAMN04489793_1303 [Tsukamurella tyrosinosolvens]VEH99965.1 Uncharacterised protein [Tsukamurella tyrosinosolvens]